MAHEAMEYNIQVQVEHPASEQLVPDVFVTRPGQFLILPPHVEVVSSQEGSLVIQPNHVEVVNRQEQAPLLEPTSVERADSQGMPPLLQPPPADGGHRHFIVPLLPPAPQGSVSQPEEVGLAEEVSVETMDPGAPEQHGQIPAANHNFPEASLGSVSNFISGLQRLHGMLEFLRPPTAEHSVGPVRVRRRGAASRRARIGGSQRTDNARLRTPLDAYFQVSRTQPPMSDTTDNSGTRNPVPENLVLSSGSASDSDSSAENEEVVAQPEQPGDVILEEQEGGVSTQQEATCTDEGKVASEQSCSGPSPVAPSASVDDEEGDTCTICLEQWTSAGEHRLTALRCGHLFGYKCISQWLKGQARKCPQCNKKAKHSDIVVLYARNLRALDTSEQEQLKSSLLKEQMLRKHAELESAQCRLQLEVLTNECTKLQSRIQDLQALILQHRQQTLQQPGGSQAQSLGCQPSSQGQHKYRFEKTFPVSQTGNCRIMAYCDSLSCLVVSQPSPQASFLPGFGVRMLSTANMKSTQYIPMHSKQIRGLAFNTRTKGLLLSASLDNTIKLTSLETNTVVQTYNTGRPVWSCCWCLDENHFFYAGLVSGSILVYDLRNTRCHVQELVSQRARCPMVSLSYIPKAASAAFPYGGVLAGTLENACFWELKAGLLHWPYSLPLEQGGCIDFQTESNTRHCLVTFRPDKNHNTMRSVLMEMSHRINDAGDRVCLCNPVQTFHGGPTCKLLTKNAIFQSPKHDGSLLVCTGDEASNSALLWDAGSGSKLQDLQTDQPVLDICPFEVNHSSYLATLTEKTVHLYRWQ